MKRNSITAKLKEIFKERDREEEALKRALRGRREAKRKKN